MCMRENERDRTENRDNRNRMGEREASLHKVINSERPKEEDIRTKRDHYTER